MLSPYESETYESKRNKYDQRLQELDLEPEQSTFHTVLDCFKRHDIPRHSEDSQWDWTQQQGRMMSGSSSLENKIQTLMIHFLKVDQYPNPDESWENFIERINTHLL